MSALVARWTEGDKVRSTPLRDADEALELFDELTRRLSPRIQATWR